MVICLVTDRRRLGAAVGARPAAWLEVLEAQVAAAGAAAIDLVQIREPDLDARLLAAFVRSAANHLGGSRTRLLVNDRLDVALAAGAAGVHLKESSIAPEQARRLAASSEQGSASARETADKPPRLIVTCAVHTPFTAAARSSADFLIAGTVLPTVSKPRADYLGWKGLGEVVGAAKATPVLGIGGLDLASVTSLAAVGAAGLAAVGAFIPPPGQSGIEEFVKKRVTEMRFAFDSVQSRP
jgi:thiamine-phosphate diphosphorylase